MSAEPYYNGREAYKTGVCLPPKEYDHVQRAQWDTGWRDAHLRNPDPILTQNLQQVVYDLRGNREITVEQVDLLEKLAQEMEKSRK